MATSHHRSWRRVVGCLVGALLSELALSRHPSDEIFGRNSQENGRVLQSEWSETDLVLTICRFRVWSQYHWQWACVLGSLERRSAIDASSSDAPDDGISSCPACGYLWLSVPAKHVRHESPLQSLFVSSLHVSQNHKSSCWAGRSLGHSAERGP